MADEFRLAYSDDSAKLVFDSERRDVGGSHENCLLEPGALRKEFNPLNLVFV